MMRWMSTIILCMAFITTYAQPKKEVREGNKLYKEQNYKGAAEAYQKALMKKPNYTPGLFNLGNAQYKQQQFDASRKIYKGTAKTVKDKKIQAAANYNIGNTYMEEKKYKEAVEAYKEALRKNPQDEQAKYNLSYALEKLKQQQGGGGKNNKDKDKKDNKKDQQKKDKNKNEDQKNKDQQKDKQDQQNKDKQKDKQDKQDQQQQNKDQKDKNKEKEEQRPQGQPSKLSKQQAEQLLNALQQEEKKLQDKLKKGKGVPVKVEKDW